MSERTITKEELEAVMADQQGLSHAIFHAVIDAAFPPVFDPKKGVVMQVSDTGDFLDNQFRKFSHMDVHGRYICNGFSNKLIPWIYAKPLTPTQKGE